MPSSFKSIDLFGSGPHRFAVGAQGEQVLSNLRNPIPLPGSTPIGPLELVVKVTGRLVAASESALWALRDAITAEFAHPPVPGTLVDHHGRTWTGMCFVTFEEGDRTDRGRTRSVEYSATFLRFLGT